MVLALPALEDRSLGQIGGAAGPLRIGGTKALRGVASLGAPRPFKNVVPSSASYVISGVTKDSTGAPLGNCKVKMFETVSNAFIEEVLSDGSGVFAFGPAVSRPHFLVAWGPSGAVAGITLDTLTGT